MKSKSKKCNIIPPIVEKEKKKEEGLTEKLIFKVTPAMRRAGEIVSRELGITMGDLLRAGTAYFLSRYEDILDEEVVEAMKRESLRRVTLSKVDEYMEGIELLENLKDEIEKKLRNAYSKGMLDDSIFELLLKIVSEAKGVVEGYKDHDLLLSKIQEIENDLKLRREIFQKTGRLLI